jgi:hypothetical protein
MPSTTRSIHSFADAVATALGLYDLYGRYAALALLDDDRTIIDMTPFSGDAACVLCAVEWADCLLHSDPHSSQAVLLSGTEQSVLELREDDVRLFGFIRDELGALDVEVLDWIQTDGENIRSLAFSCDVDTVWEAEVDG